MTLLLKEGLPQQAKPGLLEKPAACGQDISWTIQTEKFSDRELFTYRKEPQHSNLIENKKMTSNSEATHYGVTALC
ncbi:hypothetical protein SynBIOSE41_03050 [Synechococcus sp. BIOS-E4-1]|nr:hypothetical protein SynBIOSE41_03050 [Synechococcus sp. BIOS-E4-1]